MHKTVSPDNSDASIEQLIVAKGKIAARVTPSDIESAIVSEFYFVGGDGIYGDASKRGDHSVQSFPESLDLLTFCVLVLRNGFTVTGTSACASPQNFDPDIGKRIARDNAVRDMWPLLGYQLKEQLYQMTQPAQSPV